MSVKWQVDKTPSAAAGGVIHTDTYPLWQCQQIRKKSVETGTPWSSPSPATGFVSGWFQSMDLSQCPRNLVAFSNPCAIPR